MEVKKCKEKVGSSMKDVANRAGNLVSEPVSRVINNEGIKSHAQKVQAIESWIIFQIVYFMAKDQ